MIVISNYLCWQWLHIIIIIPLNIVLKGPRPWLYQYVVLLYVLLISNIFDKVYL